jgi:hypothetical protein
MGLAPRYLLTGLFCLSGLAACGGSSGGGGGLALNAFTGTLTISGALPAGTTACLTTHTVTFTAAGADLHSVDAAGGDCLAFTNSDTAQHQPAGRVAACSALNGPALGTGATFTTAPLSGPLSCPWEDALNPPTSGGGGGGGY